MRGALSNGTLESPLVSQGSMRYCGFILLAALTLLVAQAWAQNPQAHEALNQGVQAYKAGRYSEAVEHFKRAVELDPALTNARLYLATTYANLYNPGVESEENLRIAQQAIEEFQRVLQREYNNVAALSGLASLHFNMEKLDEARDWYLRLIQIEPQNPTPYYSVGVIGWTQTYHPRKELKTRLGLHLEDPIQDDAARRQLCGTNLPIIEESQRMLHRALELRPDYDDAMAYLNLMYRERADCQSYPNERAADLKLADEWVARTLETKRNRASAREGFRYTVPSPSTSSADTSKRVRVGGQVQESKLLAKVDPEYPALARQARIQGTVRLDAVIGKTGEVASLRVISGHPLLVQAALDSVRQWRYQQTFLNGEPVEVVTTIDVNFSLPY